MSQPRVLLIARQAPYGNTLARSALDAALAGAAFDRAPTLLFMGDGVLQLLGDQDAAELGTRTHGRVLDSLPLYDIETFYVDGETLARYGVDPDNLPSGARVVDDAAIRGLLGEHDHILSF